MSSFKDIMFATLSDAEVRALPDEWRALWILRPNKEDSASAKTAMQLRASLIVIAGIYIYFSPGQVEEIARYLIWLVAAYEFAYYEARKKQCEQAYILAMLKYMDQADKLDGLKNSG